MKDGLENLEFILVGKNRMILRLLVLTHYHRVTDRHTYRHAAYAYERDKSNGL